MVTVPKPAEEEEEEERKAAVAAGGRAARCLSALGVQVWMACEGPHSQTACVVVNVADQERVVAALRAEFSGRSSGGSSGGMNKGGVGVEALAPVALISVVTERLQTTPGIASRFFRACGTAGVNVCATIHGNSALSFTAVVHDSQASGGFRAPQLPHAARRCRRALPLYSSYAPAAATPARVLPLT